MRALAVAVLGAAALVSCSSDPHRAYLAYLSSGDTYLADKKYSEAIIQYRNAVGKDPRSVDAHLKLAEAYVADGGLTAAVAEYVRAADLVPDDPQVQLRVGKLFLKGGLYEEAELRAKQALARDPNNVEALILLGSSSTGAKNLDSSIATIKEAIELEPNRAASYTSLGMLVLKSGNRETAEAAFKKAVDVQPDSILAHLALANYYLTIGHFPDGERVLKRALELDARNVLTNRAMGLLCLIMNRPLEAEPYLRLVADLSGLAGDRLMLADYYVRTGRNEAARPLLQALASNKNTSTTAKLRLAAVDYVQNRKTSADKTLDDVLAEAPNNPDARLMKAQRLVEQGNVEQALSQVKIAADAAPSSAAVQFALGKLYKQRGQMRDAVQAFTQAVKLNPLAAAAQVELSRLTLDHGDTEVSLELARQAVRNQPEYAEAQLSLVRSLIASRQIVEAEEAMKPLLTRHADSAAVQTRLGDLRFLKGDRRGARAALEEALRLDPNAGDALSALIQMDVVEKRRPQAIARAETHLAQNPGSVPAMLSTAATYVLTEEHEKAEALLLKIIQIAPSTFKAYGLLGQLCVTRGDLDKARSLFEDSSRRSPEFVGSYIMVGLILEAENRRADAKAWYEKALQIDPRSPVAANNLAWMLATEGGNLDVALRLSQTAVSRAPEEPDVNDTLGWVLYKKDLASRAVSPLLISVKGSPKNPTYRYHLGLAYAKAGDAQQARKALGEALTLNPNFAEAGDARRVLASMP